MTLGVITKGIIWSLSYQELPAQNIFKNSDSVQIQAETGGSLLLNPCFVCLSYHFSCPFRQPSHWTRSMEEGLCLLQSVTGFPPCPLEGGRASGGLIKWIPFRVWLRAWDDSTCTQVGVEAFLLQHDEQRAPSQQHGGEEQILDDRRHGHPPPSPVRCGQAGCHAGERQPPHHRVYWLNDTQIISTTVIVAV